MTISVAPLCRYRDNGFIRERSKEKKMVEAGEGQRRTRVIAVGNQKGGVGKTTNTVHIARALAELGRRVLIIDLDMNHGATRHFGIEPEAFLGSFELMVGAEDPLNLVLSAEDKQEGVVLPENVNLI